MNTIALALSPSVEQSQNAAIEGGALSASEPEIMVLDESLLALIGGGDGIVIW
jgi:hypothetical protein